jgi:predicted nucleic acid-binding protein
MTLSWAFEDESSAVTVAVLKSLETVHAVAPALWPFEVANALTAAERRGRISAAEQAEFLERLRLLPVEIEHRPSAWLAQQILPLARSCRLTAYDAAYRSPRSMTTSAELPRPLAWRWWKSRNCCAALVS